MQKEEKSWLNVIIVIVDGVAKYVNENTLYTHTLTKN